MKASLFFLIVLSLQVFTACTFKQPANIDKNADKVAMNNVNPPASWQYVQLGDLPFEMPLPGTHAIKQVNDKTVYIESNSMTNDGKTLNNDYFFLFLQHVPIAKTVEEFIANQCYAIDGTYNYGVTSVSGNEFPLETTVNDSFIVNGIEFTPLDSNCPGLFTLYVLRNGEDIYHFALADLGYSGSSSLSYMAMLNVRPVSNELEPQ